MSERRKKNKVITQATTKHSKEWSPHRKSYKEILVWGMRALKICDDPQKYPLRHFHENPPTPSGTIFFAIRD